MVLPVSPFGDAVSQQVLAAAGLLPTAGRGAIVAALAECIEDTFEDGDWKNLANRLGDPEAVTRHGRLLRSLRWNDPDYSGHVHDVLVRLLGQQLQNLPAIVDRTGLSAWLESHDPGLYSQLYGSSGVVVDDADLSGLSDAAAIAEQLRRLRDIDPIADPALAIGTSKELIESTAKVLLHDLGQAVEPAIDYSTLIERLHRALSADPSLVGDGPEANATKRVLGGLKSLALGVDEMRNKVGTGHGRLEATNLLGSHLGRLAVDSAATYCRALLAMHVDRGRRTSSWGP